MTIREEELKRKLYSLQEKSKLSLSLFVRTKAGLIVLAFSLFVGLFMTVTTNFGAGTLFFLGILYLGARLTIREATVEGDLLNRYLVRKREKERKERRVNVKDDKLCVFRRNNAPYC